MKKTMMLSTVAAVAALATGTAFAELDAAGNATEARDLQVAQSDQPSATQQQADQSGNPADQQMMTEVGKLVEQASQSLQQDDKATAREALQQADEQIRENLKQAQGQTSERLTEVQEHVQTAMTALDGDKTDEARQALNEAMQPLERGGAYAATGEAGQSAGEGAPRGADIEVSQPQPKVNVQTPAPEVTANVPKPEVTVQQPTPEVTVVQPEPKVTVQVPEPNVTVEAAQPDVQVQTAEPKVTVRTPEPEVKVDQAGKADVKVQEPETAEATGGGQMDQTGAGQTDTSQTQTGAGTGQKTTGGDMAGTSGGGFAGGEEVVGMSLYGANDEEIGEIEDIVMSQDGKVEAVVVEVGGFLGIGQKRVAIPADQLQLEQDRVVAQTLTEQQVKEFPEFAAQ